MRSPAGRSMRPAPKGQMPASARISMVRPVPGSPAMATCSPAESVAFAPSSSTRPRGASTRSASSRSLPGLPLSMRIPPLSNSRCAASIVSEKLCRRSMLARQRAISS